MCPSVAQYQYLLGVGLMTAGDSLSAVGAAGEGGRARSRSAADADRARPRVQQPEALRRREAAPAAQPRARSRQCRNARRARRSRSRPRRHRGRRIPRRRVPSRRSRACDREPRHRHGSHDAAAIPGGARCAARRRRRRSALAQARISIEPRLSRASATRRPPNATSSSIARNYATWNRPSRRSTERRDRHQADEHARLVARRSRLVGAMGLQPPAAPELLFRDITREAGITFAASRRPGKEVHRRVDERRRGARSTTTTTGCRTSTSSTR